MMDAQVIVVGGGPVGVLNALGLAQAGIEVILLEQSVEVPNSPRAVVYPWSALDGLDALGVLDECLARGFAKRDYQCFVPETGERIDWTMDVLSAITSRPFNLHLGQHQLVALVLDQLGALPNVRVMNGTRVSAVSQDDESVLVRAMTAAGEEITLRAEWLVGTDGAGSTVRKESGLAFDGMTWADRFVATNVRFDFQSLGYAQSTAQVDSRLGAIIVKLDETDLWRVTFMEDESLPLEGMTDRIAAFYGEVMGPHASWELDAYSPYKMHQRSAPSYRHGRILLAGDAAHVTNPCGAFGLTSGLFDTFALYPALAAIVKGQADAARLDIYSRERRDIFLGIVSPAASAIKGFLFGEQPPEKRDAELSKLRKETGDPKLLLERLRVSEKLMTRAPI